MPIISMNIEKDVEKVSGLDETEYLDKGGRIEKFNQTTEETETNAIVKPKAKKVKTQKQLDALANAREKKRLKAEEKKNLQKPVKPVETVETLEETEESEVEDIEELPKKIIKKKKKNVSQEIDYDSIVNSVFSRITAKQEKEKAEANARAEMETKIRQDERNKIMSEFNSKRTVSAVNRNVKPSPLDPNQFLRPKTHNNGINWDSAFQPR